MVSPYRCVRRARENLRYALQDWVACVTDTLDSPKRVSGRQVVVTLLGLLLVLGVLLAGVWGLYILFAQLLASGLLASPVSVYLATGGTLLGAIGLYVLKSLRRVQMFYGLLEIAVGLVANWRALHSLSAYLASITPLSQDEL